MRTAGTGVGSDTLTMGSSRTLLCCLLLALGLLLAGCGSGSHTSTALKSSGAPSTTTGTTGNGKAAITVQWPARGRIVPKRADSVKIEVMTGPGAWSAQVLNRATTGTYSTALFVNLNGGATTVRATAYPNADAQGVALASGTTQVTVSNGQTALAVIDLDTTIHHVTLSSTTTTGVNTLALIATPFDADGHVVLLADQDIYWKSDTPAVATVDASGLVTARSAGQATIRAVEQESGMAGALSLTIAGSQSGYVITTGGQAFSLAIYPPVMTTTASGTVKFTGQITGAANPELTWSVQEADGGTVHKDNINSATYTAPTTLGDYHVIAASVANPSQKVVALVHVVGPLTLSATVASLTSVILHWDAITSAPGGYSIQRSTDGTTWITRSSVQVDIANVIDTTVTTGNSYYYRVISLDANGQAVATSNAVPIYTGPRAPTNLAGDLAPSTDGSGSYQFHLAWNLPPGGYATGFTIYRSAVARKRATRASNILATIPWTDAASFEYLDTTARNGVEYSYSVVTMAGNLTSDASSTVTRLIPPGNAGDIQLYPTRGQTMVTWTPPTMATTTAKFQIWRSTTLVSGAVPVDAASLSTNFTKLAAMGWSSSYIDYSPPLNTLNSYVVVVEDVAGQTSIGPYTVKQTTPIPVVAGLRIIPDPQYFDPSAVHASSADRSFAVKATDVNGAPIANVSFILKVQPVAGSEAAFLTNTYGQITPTNVPTTNVAGQAYYTYTPPAQIIFSGAQLHITATEVLPTGVAGTPKTADLVMTILDPYQWSASINIMSSTITHVANADEQYPSAANLTQLSAGVSRLGGPAFSISGMVIAIGCSDPTAAWLNTSTGQYVKFATRFPEGLTNANGSVVFNGQSTLTIRAGVNTGNITLDLFDHDIGIRRSINLTVQ